MTTENGEVRSMEKTLSGEQTDASEETEVTSETRTMWREDEETPEETDEESTEETETETEETPKEKTYTHAEYQSAVDKAVNKHREVHEKDAELIRTLQEKEKDYRKQIREKSNSGEFEALFNADLEDGMDEDKAKKLDSLRKQFKSQYDEMKDSIDEVTETADLITTISKNMNADYVKDWGLNDPNPYARAANGLNLINEAIGLHETNTLKSEIFEVLVSKGTELRKSIDDLATELQGLSKDARKLRLEKIRDELKITPKSGPPKPTRETGEKSRFTRQEIANMSPEEYEKNRDKIQAALDAGQVK